MTMNKITSQTEIEPRLLDVNDLAKLSKTTPYGIRNLTRKAKLPVTRLGRRVMFDKFAIDEFIRKNTVREVE